MSGKSSVEICCPACKQESLLLRKPRYDGLKKTGERLLCAACKHEFADEAAIPFKGQARPQVFSEADRPAQVKIFQENEAARLCRQCEHYVINPFLQRCALHQKEVAATDTCPRFCVKPKPPEAAPSDPLLQKVQAAAREPARKPRL